LDFDLRIAKLLQQVKINESNPRYLLEKSLKDIEDLERFYKDKQYRNTLESATYPSLEYCKLENIEKQEEKLKEKLGIPQNSIIKYQKVKCSKTCKHPKHWYYYAYIWDSTSKRLKSKYIGKQLPLPANLIAGIVFSYKP
jgi:hypothetical protein